MQCEQEKRVREEGIKAGYNTRKFVEELAAENSYLQIDNFLPWSAEKQGGFFRAELDATKTMSVTLVHFPAYLPGHWSSTYVRVFPHTPLLSLALFASWLRSSVVSVLFSLISEIFLREKSMIKFIFVNSEVILWACSWSLTLCHRSYTAAG